MTNDEIIDWGRERHFPFLVLDGDDPLQHGEREWCNLIASKDVRRITRVVKRIEMWNRIAKDVVSKEV